MQFSMYSGESPACAIMRKHCEFEKVMLEPDTSARYGASYRDLTLIYAVNLYHHKEAFR